MQHLVLTAVAQRSPLVLLKIDVEKAYDKVDRARLWALLLHHYHFPPALVAALQGLYVELSAVIKGRGALSPPFPMRGGVRQGCPCSPLLFSLIYERIVARVRELVGARQYAKDVPHVATVAVGLLLYADDLLICARSAPAAARLLAACATFCGEAGLTINAGKCAVLAINTPADGVRLGDTPIAVVTTLEYLGVGLTARKSLLRDQLKKSLASARVWALRVQQLAGFLRIT